jgi:hypothetical protein
VHRLWKVGERPLSANHILRVPFAFCLGRAFKLAIAKSASGVADNQYLRVSFRFLSWACVYKVVITKSASGCMPTIFMRAVPLSFLDVHF